MGSESKYQEGYMNRRQAFFIRLLISIALASQIASLTSYAAFIHERQINAKDREAHVRALYEKSEYYIPMRDGVKLYTQVYAPKDQTQKYPILLFRTPYSISYYGPQDFRNVLGPNALYADEGYIFVY